MEDQAKTYLEHMGDLCEQMLVRKRTRLLLVISNFGGRTMVHACPADPDHCLECLLWYRLLFIARPTGRDQCLSHPRGRDHWSVLDDYIGHNPLSKNAHMNIVLLKCEMFKYWVLMAASVASSAETVELAGAKPE